MYLPLLGTTHDQFTSVSVNFCHYSEEGLLRNVKNKVFVLPWGWKSVAFFVTKKKNIGTFNWNRSIHFRTHRSGYGTSLAKSASAASNTLTLSPQLPSTQRTTSTSSPALLTAKSGCGTSRTRRSRYGMKSMVQLNSSLQQTFVRWPCQRLHLVASAALLVESLTLYFL